MIFLHFEDRSCTPLNGFLTKIRLYTKVKVAIINVIATVPKCITGFYHAKPTGGLCCKNFNRQVVTALMTCTTSDMIQLLRQE